MPRGKPPAMPRIIQWQGEPLEFLKRLGFNAIAMGRLPSPAELAEANRVGLWIVCPPPTTVALEARGLGPEYAGVLAWDLGELADQSDVALIEPWARHDSTAGPSRPAAHRAAAARNAARGEPHCGCHSAGATDAWLDRLVVRARRLAGPESAVGPPGHGDVGGHRFALFRKRTGTTGRVARRAPAGAAGYAHLSREITAAVGTWPRGFWFTSQASLAAGDPETRMRAAALELTNLRLGMIEPWLSGGKAASPARSTADLSAMVLTVERSHLVIPMRWEGVEPASSVAAVDATPRRVDPTIAAHSPAADPVTFVLPGVPESCEAYLLSISGPRQLSTKRITGGLSLTVEHLPDDAFILLTEDGYAFTHVDRYLKQCAPQAAKVRVELAELERRGRCQRRRAATPRPPGVRRRRARSGDRRCLAGRD